MTFDAMQKYFIFELSIFVHRVDNFYFDFW